MAPIQWRVALPILGVGNALSGTLLLLDSSQQIELLGLV
jgi:hypothetical protein